MSRSPLRRWLLVSLCAIALALSCTPGFLAPSAIVSLRILAVTIDKPYAQPGDEVTMRMTVTDGIDNRTDPATPRRDLQLVWLSGCVNPSGDQYFACIESLSDTLAPLAAGGFPPEDVLKLEKVSGERDGEPDAHSFTFTIPEDIVSSRPVPSAGPHYGVEYVFFAACAGTLAPVTLESTGGEVPDFPLECRDENGQPQGSDSFVIGYTQVYVFADGRVNNNPVAEDIIINATKLEACPVPADDRRKAGCAANEDLDACSRYDVRVFVGDDVAEVDEGAEGPDGEPIDEVVWVSYFVEGGDLDPSLALIHDATKGRQTAFQTELTPPELPGLYRVWAVVRDQRGGSSVVMRELQVE